MKNNRKSGFLKVLCLALSLMFVFSLASCKKDGESEESSDVKTGESGQTETEGTLPKTDTDALILKSDLEKFKVVYSDKDSKEVQEAAESIAKMIKSVCGVTIPATNDYVKEGSTRFCEYEYEIILGNTEREAGIEFNRSLRANDYGYTVIGKKIVISGRKSENTVKAANDFAINVISKHKSDDALFRPEWSKLVKENYKVNDFKINGEDVYNFDIVYPVSNKFMEKDFAERISRLIAEKTGYVLNVFSERAYVDDGYNKIKVGITDTVKDKKDGVGYMANNGKDIEIEGKSASEISLAVSELLDSVKDGQNLVIDSTLECRINRESIRAMSFNVLVAPIGKVREDRVISTIVKSMPDVLGVQEAGVDWMQILENRLGAYYDFVGEGTQGATPHKGNEHCAIFYSKARFNLIETDTYWLTDTPEINSELPGSQWPRVYTYAILEDKETKEKFMHLNIHLDTNMAIQEKEVELLLEFLDKKGDIPTIVSGDFNNISSSKPIQMFFDYGFIEPMKALDKDVLDGKEHLDATHYDYVIVSDKSLQITDYTVEGADIDGAQASDHPAVYIDFKFKKNKK